MAGNRRMALVHRRQSSIPEFSNYGQKVCQQYPKGFQSGVVASSMVVTWEGSTLLLSPLLSPQPDESTSIFTCIIYVHPVYDTIF